MYYYISILHLSSLLLLLQYCYLFISFIYHFHYHYFTPHISFSLILYFFIFYSYFFSSFSSPLRSSLVNILLYFNPSLIIFAPSSPILLSIYFIYISFSLSLFHHTHFFLSFFFIVPSYFFSSFSSPLRPSPVNVLLLFNPSPIIFAPSSPILLSIYFIYISFSLFCLSFFLCISLKNKIFITHQIQFSTCILPHYIQRNLCFDQSINFISNMVFYLFHSCIHLRYHYFTTNFFLFCSFLYFFIISSYFFSSFSSLSRLNTINVLLLFNASLIILAPSSPILISIYFINIYHFHHFTPHFFLSFSFLYFLIYYLFLFPFLLFHHRPDPAQSMYYYISVLHLSL